MSKVFALQEHLLLDLVERINDFNEEYKVIATQIFPRFEKSPEDDSWYAVIYYEDNKQGKNPSEKPTSFQRTPASKSQLDLLKKLGYEGNINLSKQEAWGITKELKEKR